MVVLVVGVTTPPRHNNYPLNALIVRSQGKESSEKVWVQIPDVHWPVQILPPLTPSFSHGETLVKLLHLMEYCEDKGEHASYVEKNLRMKWKGLSWPYPDRLTQGAGTWHLGQTILLWVLTWQHCYLSPAFSFPSSTVVGCQLGAWPPTTQSLFPWAMEGWVQLLGMCLKGRALPLTTTSPFLPPSSW